MKAKHLVTYFVAPVFFYLAICMYFLTGASLLAVIMLYPNFSPSFIVVGLIMFVLGYNAWLFAKTMKSL